MSSSKPDPKTPTRSSPQNTLVPPTVTNIKANSSQQYLSSIASMDDLRPMVGDEVRSYFAKSSPLGVRDFLDKHLPLDIANSLSTKRVFPSTLFMKVNEADREQKMYAPLCVAFTDILRIMCGDEEPILRFEVTSKPRETLAAELYEMAPNICGFHRDVSDNEISWEYVDIPVEVKFDSNGDPVSTQSSVPDPISAPDNVIQSTTRDDSMAQIADYYRCTTFVQARRRVFLLGIFGNFARFFMFDRAGVAFSEAFNYNKNPDLLGDFLYRYSRSGRAARGWDPTVTYELSDVEQEKIETAFKTWNKLCENVRTEHKVHMEPVVRKPCRITAHHNGTEHVYLTLGGPIFASLGAFCRGTRIWFAFDSSKELAEDASNAVVIKDSWTQDTLEGEFYESLGEYGPDDGIAQYSFSASFEDSEFHKTANHDRIDAVLRRQCRTVINTLGRRLSRYKSTKELVKGIYSAVAGHQKAYNKGVLHRDISERNVILPLIPKTPLGGGFIIDFDLSLFHSVTHRNHRETWDLTGTVQFMAVARLKDKGCSHEVWHDLESFFWVLLFVVSRHTWNSWKEGAEQQAMLIALFETPSLRHLATLRRSFLLMDKDDFSVKDNVPLTDCIHKLARLFAHAYPIDRSTDPVLATHDDVLRILSDTLSEEGWPDGDSPLEWNPPRMRGGNIQPIARHAISQQSRGGGSPGSNLGKRKSGSGDDPGPTSSSKKSRGGAL